MIDPAPPPPTDEKAERSPDSLFSKPPGALVTAAAVLLGIVILWLLSYPGGSVQLATLCLVGLVALLAVWVVRTVTFVKAGHQRGSPWRLAIVPVVLLLVAALGLTSTPSKVRFGLAKDDFQAEVDQAPVADCATEPTEFDVPDRIGSFNVSKAYCLGDAVVFLVPGGFFSNVGFAKLPSGSFPELETGDLDKVEFTKLAGDWYSFATST